jgi:uncharacterized protein (UPF0305 family)
MYEVILADIFSHFLGVSVGPQIPLFKRFTAVWPVIDKTKFEPASDESFTEDLVDLRADMISFYSRALEKDEFPRDDYAEILHLSLVFLGGAPVKSIQFRAPGALHHARWMAKVIFCLKICSENR